MKIFTTLLVLLTLISCNDFNDDQFSDEFQVTVVGTGIDCRLPLIDFLHSDSSRIADLSGNPYWLRYHAFGLDSSLMDVGLTLNVTVRKTRDNELSPCTTLGIGYPWITILAASKVN